MPTFTIIRETQNKKRHHVHPRNWQKIIKDWLFPALSRAEGVRFLMPGKNFNLAQPFWGGIRQCESKFKSSDSITSCVWILPTKVLAQGDNGVHFTLVIRWKQHKCPAVGEWVYRLQCVDAMECYPVVKENKEMLNELVQKAKKSKSKKHTHCVIPSIFLKILCINLYIHGCLHMHG